MHGDPEKVGKRSSPALDWITENARFEGDDCLPWPFHVGKDGYGRVHEPRTGKLMTASRLMCVTAHGEPENPKLQAAHSCGNGNKACANPKHLYWTDHADNQADRVEHGTTNRGERYGLSKLTEADVRYIRSVNGIIPQKETAEKLGVDQITVSDIVRRKRWGWLD